MTNKIPLGLLISACFFLLSCEKKKSTPLPPSGKYSSVETKTQINADGLLDLRFKVNVTDNMQYTFDAPWSLELIEHGGLNFAQSSFPSSSLNQDIPEYSAISLNKPNETSGKVKYKLIAFICTDDKKQCFREVHENEIEWTNQAALGEKKSTP